MNQKQLKKITNFLFELSMLKRQKHSGPALAGVNNLNSLADHTVRTATIAYILADLEGADPEICASMCLIHDFPETRIGDRNKVSARYLKSQAAEKKAFLEQTRGLPENVRKKWLKFFTEKEKRNTLEGIVAQDADWLEAAISAREFIAQGNKAMQDWIDNPKKSVETQSAKEIIRMIEKTDPSDWWTGLKKMTYKKLSKKLKKKLLK